MAVFGGMDGQQDAQVPRQRQKQHQGEHGHLHLRHLLIPLQGIRLIRPAGSVEDTWVPPGFVELPEVTLVWNTFHCRSLVFCRCVRVVQSASLGPLEGLGWKSSSCPHRRRDAREIWGGSDPTSQVITQERTAFCWTAVPHAFYQQKAEESTGKRADVSNHLHNMKHLIKRGRQNKAQVRFCGLRVDPQNSKTIVSSIREW